MPLSTDVNLPKHHKARFPDKCVVCGRPSPESSVRLITGSIGWWTWLLWVFGKPFTAFSDSVDYEFRDEDLAYEFAELNEDATWVKIS